MGVVLVVYTLHIMLSTYDGRAAFGRRRSRLCRSAFASKLGATVRLVVGIAIYCELHYL